MNTQELHKNGFTVMRRFLSASETDILFTAVSEYAGAHRMDPIFNYNAEAKNDRKRRQIDMPATLSRHLCEKLTAATRGKEDRHATDLVILESVRGCQRQAAHVDYVPDAALLETTDETVPLLAVVALQSGTFLDVWPGSHRLIRRERLTRHTPHVRRETVELDAGDVIVFRGDLIHAGSEYSRHNLRLHAYIDHPSVPRPPNKTWVIQRHAEPLLQAAVDES